MFNPLQKYQEKRQAEKEHYRKHNPEGKPTRMQTTVKIIVGLYLFYLVYGMIKDGGLERTGGEKIMIIAAIVLFVGCGIFFCIKGIKGLMAGDFYNPYETDEELEEKMAESKAADGEANAGEAEDGSAKAKNVKVTAKEEPDEDKPKSLADLARLSASAQVPEDEQ